jgi:hypothetical protein
LGDGVVSAISELRAGTPSTAFTDLLIKTVLAVARSHGFPPPNRGKWDKQAAAEVAGEFVGHHRTGKILEALLLTCADDRTLAVALQAVIRNFLRDRGRATEMGRLVVRINRALKAPRYQRLPGSRFALAEGPAEASAVPPDELVAATAGIRVTYPRWDPMSDRRPPFASKYSIDELVAAVMIAAAGSLRAADVAHAIAPVLQVAPGNTLVELDEGDPPDTGDDISGLESLGIEIEDRERAFEVFGLLSTRQKIALGYLDLGVREIGRRIGRGHSQAAVILGAARTKLKEELVEEENGQEIARLVIQIARFWVYHRTAACDVTYNAE